MVRTRIVVAAIGFALALAGCGKKGTSSGKPKVAVSIFPLYDLTRRIAGDRLDVMLVLPPGKSEHGYDPTPKEIARLEGAKLGLAVGLDMDGWVENIMKTAGGAKIVRIGDKVPTIPIDVDPITEAEAREHDEHDHHDDAHGQGSATGSAGAGSAAKTDDHGHGNAGDKHDDHDGHDDHGKPGDKHDDHGKAGDKHDDHDDHGKPEDKHDDDHGKVGDKHDDHGKAGDKHDDHGKAGDKHDDHAGHGHGAKGAPDPHVWMDPERMLGVIDQIAAELAVIDPDGKDTYTNNAEALKASLKDVDAKVLARSKTWTKRTIITFHGSMSYFAKRYGIRIAAVVEPIAGKEPTPAYIAQVIGAVKIGKAAALFTEPQLDRGPGETIAKEAGIPLGELDPVGGVPGRDTYETLLTWNADQLEKLLR
ncbi:MAG: metal ABC transporter substrate-binding protein [Kofleriaceae bacterium]